MAESIAQVLTYANGVAISPVPIIAVILTMMFLVFGFELIAERLPVLGG